MVDRTRMRIRRKIRLRLGNHRLLFFRAEFWNTMVYDRVAITNQTTDKMYVPFWDFQENTKQEWIEHALLDVQQRFALGDIFVIQTFPRESYRAFGFDKLDFMELVSLLAETEYLDVNYLRWLVFKKYSAIRITNKEGTKDMAVGFLNGDKSTREMSYKHQVFFKKLYDLPIMITSKPEPIRFNTERYESLR